MSVARKKNTYKIWNKLDKYTIHYINTSIKLSYRHIQYVILNKLWCNGF